MFRVDATRWLGKSLAATMSVMSRRLLCCEDDGDDDDDDDEASSKSIAVRVDEVDERLLPLAAAPLQTTGLHSDTQLLTTARKNTTSEAGNLKASKGARMR